PAAEGLFCFVYSSLWESLPVPGRDEGRAEMSVAESPQRRLEPILPEVGDEPEEPALEFDADLSRDLQFGERRVEVTNRRVRELDRTRCAKCNRLLPEKNGLCPACLSRGKIILRLASYLRPYTGAAIAMVLMTLIGALVQLAPPYMTKLIIDDVLMPRHNHRL